MHTTQLLLSTVRTAEDDLLRPFIIFGYLNASIPTRRFEISFKSYPVKRYNQIFLCIQCGLNVINYLPYYITNPFPFSVFYFANKGDCLRILLVIRLWIQFYSYRASTIRLFFWQVLNVLGTRPLCVLQCI